MIRLLPFSIICLFFSSCASIKQKNTNNVNNNWSITGKLALSNGKKNGSGKIIYAFNKTGVYAKFKAPLGQGSWEIIQDKNKAQFLSTNQPPIIGDDAQTLISNELGWDFPLDNLSFWLRGHKKNTHISSQEEAINSINDDGWIISYSKWVKTEKGLMPKKIKATKSPYQVKLIIYKWEFE